jgi:hypothetical protein
MDAGAEKVVEQDVPISILFTSFARYHTGEDKLARQTQLGGRGSRQASEVRLPTASGNDRVSACGCGIALSGPNPWALASRAHSFAGSNRSPSGR